MFILRFAYTCTGTQVCYADPTHMYCIIEGVHSIAFKSPDQFHVFTVYYLLVRDVELDSIESATSCPRYWTDDNLILGILIW